MARWIALLRSPEFAAEDRLAAEVEAAGRYGATVHRVISVLEYELLLAERTKRRRRKED